MAEPRNRVHLRAGIAASPDRVFDYFTNQFHEIWMGKMEHVRQGHDPNEPLGHGFVRRMHTPAGELVEEIVTHERPGLIEYRVINGDEAKIHPITALAMRAWVLRGRRRLAKAFPDGGRP